MASTAEDGVIARLQHSSAARIDMLRPELGRGVGFRRARDSHRVAGGAPILLVETEDSGVSWMEPRDLTVEEALRGANGGPGLRIRSCHGRGANCLFADLDVQFLPETTAPNDLERLLTTGDRFARTTTLASIAAGPPPSPMGFERQVSVQQYHLTPGGEDRDEATGVNGRPGDGGQLGTACDRPCLAAPQPGTRGSPPDGFVSRHRAIGSRSPCNPPATGPARL